ncbi:MAG: type I restriction enzyme HsdR N-terminal domain-containing protein [Micropepsaceae bacterium]
MPVSSKVASRISSELKRYQSILAAAKQRDIGESDTVVIIQDMLCDVLGYDKYQHVTTEHAIKGTYVDLAVKVDNEIRFLIEAKAIGLDLKEAHVKQAIDYGANQGIEWVVLTNGHVWRVYRIHFGQPIDKSMVIEIDVLTVKPTSDEVIECFGSLSKEGFSKGSMDDLATTKQLTSKFTVAAVLMSEDLVDELRKELRRLSPGLSVDNDYLTNLLSAEVIKRDLIDSDEAKAAAKTVQKLQRSRQRKKEQGSDGERASSTAHRQDDDRS